MHENIPGLIKQIQTRFNELAASLKLDAKTARFKELEGKMGAADFWDKPSAAQGVVDEMKGLKVMVEPALKVKGQVEDLGVLWEMACEAGDEGSKREADAMIDPLLAALDKMETTALLGGKYDGRSCFLTIQSGAGGTEADDWTEMLYRMYINYCEGQGWKLGEVSKTYGTVAGLKEVTLFVEGPMAFGMLSAERGTHRLARVSPYNAEGKRQTSFATVDVTPEFPETDGAEVNPQYLETIAFVRASGPGGQNVNKVATAVRLVYKTPEMAEPIMVVTSAERSLEQNKRRAMSILAGRLELMEEEKREAEQNAAAGGAMSRGWGSQIRSYVFYDNRVKDHRSNYEEPNPERVLSGRLDKFIEAELKRRATERH